MPLTAKTQAIIMLYPLRFYPLYKRYLWGGRKFETSLGRELPPGENFAESWEISDHGADQSVLRWGPLAGATLRNWLQGRGLNYWAGISPKPLSPSSPSSSMPNRPFPCKSIPTTPKPPGSIPPIPEKPRPGSSWKRSPGA